MPTIAVYFSDPGEMDYPFNDPLYFSAHRRFAAEMALAGISVVVVRGSSSYLGDNTFSHYWSYTETGIQAHSEPITVDLIYNKSVAPLPSTFPKDTTFNFPELDHICHDKMTTYALLGEYMPKSLAINATNWQDVLSQLRTDTITLKPIEGESGKGIHFVERASFDGSLFEFSEPYLAQEFIDTSAGIPGITPGHHDLRVLVFNGVATLAVVRVPAPGNLLANIAQGATVSPIDIESVPQAVLKIVNDVDAYLKRFTPRIYSIDFLIDKNRPYIVELNSRPGFPHPDRQGESYTATFFAAHRDIFTHFFARS